MRAARRCLFYYPFFTTIGYGRNPIHNRRQYLQLHARRLGKLLNGRGGHPPGKQYIKRTTTTTKVEEEKEHEKEEHEGSMKEAWKKTAE